jgi:hypothetical protein
MLGLRDESRRSIVDQHVDRSLLPDRAHHGVDGCAVPYIATRRADRAAEFAAHPCRGGFQQFKPPAADDQFGAEFDETASHRGPEAGTASGDQYPLSRQQAFFKHRSIPPRCIVARLQIRQEALSVRCLPCASETQVCP